MLYAEDSFFTLSMGGRIAVGCLSFALCAACLWFTYWSTRALGRVMRVCVAILVFYLFVWLSPQAYYMLYLVMIDGLPLQWVIQSPPGWRKIGALMTFTDRATLTEHGQGLLWWSLALIALLRPKSQGKS